MTVYVGGDNRLPSLAFCQRFNRDAHYGNVKDSAGLERWVSQKQMYVYGIVSRIVLGDGKATMLAIAGEAGCHPTTVSRALLKFQAWGLFAVDVKSGRNGGIRIMRPFGEPQPTILPPDRTITWSARLAASWRSWVTITTGIAKSASRCRNSRRS